MQLRQRKNNKRSNVTTPQVIRNLKSYEIIEVKNGFVLRNGFNFLNGGPTARDEATTFVFNTKKDLADHIIKNFPETIEKTENTIKI